MCLILIAVQTHPLYRLILVGNRDEFYDRPSAPVSFWYELPDLLAGKDLIGGGTWLGVTKRGKIAAITNYRNPLKVKERAPSRGRLVTGFLSGDQTPLEYIAGLRTKAEKYNGFNLIVGEREELFWYSNRGGGEARKLSAGIYGLSNGFLDFPWPKVTLGKKLFSSLLSEATILRVPCLRCLQIDRSRMMKVCLKLV